MAVAVTLQSGGPEHRLAVYGTLRHGQPNHYLIEDLGEPETGTVAGFLTEWSGYQVFHWAGDNLASGDARVEVELYRSAKLTPERWRKLDRFETAVYRRIVVPVRVADGALVTATIYAGAQP